MSVEELDAIPEIGLTVAESVRDWFADEGNRALCDRLRAAGVTTESTRTSIVEALSRQLGADVVISKTMPHGMTVTITHGDFPARLPDAA